MNHQEFSISEHLSQKNEPPRRRVKIIATLGPASESPEVLSEMIQAGMNVARLNFSHGTHAEHSKLLHTVREEARKLGRPVAVFQDLCGPKVRIGEVEGGTVHLEKGAKILLKHADGSKGTKEVLYVEAFDPVEVMKPGEPALLADGRIQLIAETVSKDAVTCIVKDGGPLKSRNGIAVPHSRLVLPCITAKDEIDLAWGIENDIDYIALSFVRSAKDIRELRDRIQAKGKNIPIIAKVERAVALDHIDEIISVSDVVMIARGDLGLELPLEKVPTAQRYIGDKSNFYGVPVITATQMMLSMVNEARPTRAEVTDVATAVRDGTDSVMLSDETTIGKHPVEAIKMLDRIICEAETIMTYEGKKASTRGLDTANIPDAVCYAAVNAASKVNASAIISCTSTGASARLMSKYRPFHPLFAATTDQQTLYRLALCWGVEPIFIQLPKDATMEDEVNAAMEAVRDRYQIKPGSRIVVTAGLRTMQKGKTNVMEIREIPRTA